MGFLSHVFEYIPALTGCIFSAFLAYILTPVCMRLALRWGVVDHPGPRKIHQEVKPLLGGLAIFIAIIATSTIGIWLFRPVHLWTQLQGLCLGGVIIFIAGVYDDRWGMSVRVKFAVQIIAAAILWLTGTQVVLFIGSPPVSFCLTVLWVVTITNSFNLLDNMDGLSVGVAAIAAGSFFLVFENQHQYMLAFLAIVLMGSLLGFLRFNFPPAKIFMGDAGSMFIGYFLAALSVMGNYLNESRLTHLPVIIPLLILAVPIFDTLSVMFLRWRAGISIFKADKRHFSHRLVNLGMTEKQAVITNYLLAIAIGLTATLLPKLTTQDAFLILVHTLILFAVIILLERASANQQFIIKKKKNN